MAGVVQWGLREERWAQHAHRVRGKVQHVGAKSRSDLVRVSKWDCCQEISNGSQRDRAEVDWA